MYIYIKLYTYIIIIYFDKIIKKKQFFNILEVHKLKKIYLFFEISTFCPDLDLSDLFCTLNFKLRKAIKRRTLSTTSTIV